MNGGFQDGAGNLKEELGGRGNEVAEEGRKRKLEDRGDQHAEKGR